MTGQGSISVPKTKREKSISRGVVEGALSKLNNRKPADCFLFFSLTEQDAKNSTSIEINDSCQLSK